MFIRKVVLCADGTESEAYKNGKIIAQDVVESINDVEIGTNLGLVTDTINEVETNGPIKFRLTRSVKNEEARKKKSITNNKKEAKKWSTHTVSLYNARKLNTYTHVHKLHTIKNAAGTVPKIETNRL